MPAYAAGCGSRSPSGRSAPATAIALTAGKTWFASTPRRTVREGAFCTVCGPALFSRDRADHESVGARLGALDRNPGVRFTHRQYVSYAASWEPIPDDGLERYPEARTE